MIKRDTRRVAECNVRQHLQAYVIDGDPAHILEALGDCAKSLPAPLAAALPILKKSLKRHKGKPLTPRSLTVLREIWALHDFPADELATPPSAEGTSNAVLRRIAKKHGMTERAVKQVLQRWRTHRASGTPTKRLSALHIYEYQARGGLSFGGAARVEFGSKGGRYK